MVELLYSDFIEGFRSFFGIPFVLNFWTALLIIVFIVLFCAGYYIIALQVKLVKKEIWGLADRIKCGIFGLIFAFAMLIVITMAVTFFNYTRGVYRNTGSILLTSFMVCLLFITLFPLVDFLAMARTQEVTALTPFQEVLEVHIINKFKAPFSYVVAFLLYVVMFIIPPFILMSLNLPFIFAWTSWQLIFPVSIITFYGAKGYMSGLCQQYYMIPNLGKSVFQAYEPGNRMSREFFDEPLSKPIVGLMLYLYVYVAFSLYQTLMFFFTQRMLVSPMSYSITVYITLIFGVVGYFSRFWGRKIKFRFIDILFAAYLLAATGINVLVKFLLVNMDKLATIFVEWEVTAVITEFWKYNDVGQPVTKSIWFVPAAVIELTVLVIFITYYFLTKKNPYVKNIIYSQITRAGNLFLVVVGFNLVRNKDKWIRDHAYETLIRMYDRLPVRKGVIFTDEKYMDPLFDAVIDTHFYSQKVGKEILFKLMVEYPDAMAEVVSKQLRSKNHTKVICVGKSLLESKSAILKKLSEQDIYGLCKSEDLEIRKIGLELLILRYQNYAISPSIDIITSLVDDVDYEIGAKSLDFLVKISEKLDAGMIFQKLGHRNSKIKTAAALAISKIGFDNLDAGVVPQLMGMMQHPDSSIRSAIFNAFSKIGNMKRLGVPLKPIYDALFDEESAVRNAAANALITYIKEAPETLNVDELVRIMQTKPNEIIVSVLDVLGNIAYLSRDKILNIMLKYIKSEDSSLKETASRNVVIIANQKTEEVVSTLLTIPEEKTFVKKGIITRTIIEIGKNHPKAVGPAIIKRLEDPNEEIRRNSTQILSELVSLDPGLIRLSHIIGIYQKEKMTSVKRELARVLQALIPQNINEIEKHIDFLFKLLIEEEQSIKGQFASLLTIIAEKNPKIIPLTKLIELSKSNDNKIKESAIKIMGVIGTQNPKESIAVLKQAMDDKDWAIKTAATESLAKLSMSDATSAQEVLGEIKKMMNSKEKWTRLKAIEMITEIGDKKAEHIHTLLKLEEISTILLNTQEDIDIKVAAAKVFGVLAQNQFEKAYPTVIKLFTDKNQKIRDAMIAGLMRTTEKVQLKDILPMLLKHFKDEEDMLVQQSIALFLKRAAKYESKDIKARIISLLKIRCEMSQDAIICQCLSELQN